MENLFDFMEKKFNLLLGGFDQFKKDLSSNLNYEKNEIEENSLIKIKES
jgi:hypothetical protein